MIKFSDNQKKIALFLSRGQASLQKIAEGLKLTPEEALNEIALLKKYGLIEKDEKGYFLSGELAERIAKRREIAEKDPFNLRLRAFIELKAIDKKLLNKHVKELKKSLESEKNITVYEIFVEKPEKEEEYYSTFIEATISVKNFQVLVNFMFFYGPSAIEILKPAKIEVSAFDLSEGLMDMADMIHRYAEYVSKIMTKRELARFNRQLFSKK